MSEASSRRDPLPRDLAEFNLVYGQAVERAKGFPEAQFKTVAALLVIDGWLLTASTAQDFIRAHAGIVLPATVMAFALLIAFKALWISAHQRRSKDLHARLVVLATEGGLSVETVSIFDDGVLQPVSFFIVNVLACLSVIAIVWLICG